MATTQLNEFSKATENNSSFLKRSYIYQKERFPIAGHGLLITAFSFSAISYSRICRGLTDFVSMDIFLPGVFITISLFLLLRISDEFKDADDDAKFRRHLPVPRGLITFRELKITAIAAFISQLFVMAFCFPAMWSIYTIVIIYLLLMGKEFFIAEWLKKHQLWYVISHMLIVPLIDVFASGLDWKLAGANPPAGLIFFFTVSFMNGIVLEIGRKIRPAEEEQKGVLTYSSMLGPTRATVLWIAALSATLILSLLAASYANLGTTPIYLLIIFFILSSFPAILFIKNKNKKLAKTIEITSGLWTIAMYLTLGGIPMLREIL
ncbi:membrane protein [Sporocytophaga myxococcoides]|uniref:Membrane protein n=1 Tax=Sporocytophaga myxococcoides TaxID=153721 RepID=A0A098LM10_9BACT|nr:UbiA family prenyltransferase [Sporocytophaga myxococcoides]GAL87362.1 membrane protein [Sporocytophaga myxococcoides]